VYHGRRRPNIPNFYELPLSRFHAFMLSRFAALMANGLSRFLAIVEVDGSVL
jgi:hypothetical protein